MFNHWDSPISGVFTIGIDAGGLRTAAAEPGKNLFRRPAASPTHDLFTE
jgi:hypothetical protein